ncbi:MAG: HEPN domain-containing protein [Candidatus Hydrothermarchaeota archaeon]
MGPSEDDIGLAKVFVRRANADLDSAIILLEHGNYADSVYHSQQSAEKMVKSILILENLFVRDHLVSSVFAEIVSREKKLNRVLEYLEDLEKHWIRTRYPFLSKGKIWDPLEEYERKDAEDA